jgi:hypothetical protein
VIAVLFSRGEKWDPERPLCEQPRFAEHVGFVTSLRERASIVEVGPLVDLAAITHEDPVGLALLDVDSADPAERLLANDPMVRDGVLVMRSHPWGGPRP